MINIAAHLRRVSLTLRLLFYPISFSFRFRRNVVKLAAYSEATEEISRPSILLKSVRTWMATLHRVEESGWCFQSLLPCCYQTLCSKIVLNTANINLPTSGVGNYYQGSHESPGLCQRATNFFVLRA